MKYLKNFEKVYKSVILMMILVVGGVFNLPILSVEASSQGQEILFIDAEVKDSSILADSAQSNMEVINLSSGSDGIDQIREILLRRHNLSAIHIISHGAPGKVFLGNGELSVENLERYNVQLKSIGNALQNEGDLLIYGCEIAKGEKGQVFIQSLANITGADVAGSNDFTSGNIDIGNSVLEVNIGEIKTQPISFNGWDGVLPNASKTVEVGKEVSLTASDLGYQDYNFVYFKSVPRQGSHLGIGDANNAIQSGFYFDKNTVDGGSIKFRGDTAGIYTFQVAWTQYNQGYDWSPHTELFTITITVKESSPTINTHPRSTTINVGDNSSFTVSASGSSLTYKWQVDTGSGFNNINNGGVYSGATTNRISIIGATKEMNGYSYRSVVTGSGGLSTNSNSAALTVNTIPVDPLTVTMNKGNALGSTKVTITESASSKFVVNITDTSTSIPREDDLAPTSGEYLINPYTSEDDITNGIAIDKYLQVYDIDADGKVVKFYQKQLQNEEIRPQPTANSISINEGATYATIANVTLKVSATHVVKMMFSKDSSFKEANWENYATTKELTLSDGDGTKTIYIKFKDEVGNETEVISDNIVLDTQGPTGTSISIDEGDYINKRNINLTIHADEVEKMMISQNSTFEGVTWENYSRTKEFMLSDGDGTKTVYIKFKDEAGNETEVINDTIELDIQAPTGGSMSIDEGDCTNTRNINLTINAVESTKMIISEDSNFEGASWKDYEIRKAFILSDNDGTKTVYIKFKDEAGNETEVISDSIELDTQAPTGGSISVDQGDCTNKRNISLTISATEAIKMMISEDHSFEGATWEDYGTSKELTLSDGNGTKVVYIKFKDEVGNETVTISDRIVIDTQAPTGISVSVDEGEYTDKRNIHLTIHATEAEKMMIGESEIFEGLSWEEYRETKELTLSNEDGKKTIYMKFKDALGNETIAISDSIVLDTIKPSKPIIKRNPDRDLYNDDYTITLISGQDFGSGAKETVYKTVYGQVYSKWQTYHRPFAISQEGTTEIFAKTIDQVGNESDIASTSLSINKDIDTFLTIKTDPNTQYSSEDYTITLLTESKDTVQNSVYASVYYNLNEGDFKTYNGPFTIAKKGQTIITAKATDDFGNTSDEVTKTVYIFSGSDEDGDGVPNEEDKYPTDPTKSGRDADKDGKDDAIDKDDDNDGIEDTKDPYPLDPTKPEKTDTIPPIIKLKGDTTIIIEQGNTYTEKGYIATDNIDEDITGNVKVTGDINTNKIGTYILTYVVEDSSGNKAKATRIIKVTEKETSKETTIKANDEEKVEDKKIEDAIEGAKEKNQKDITIKVEKEVTTENDVKVSISKEQVDNAKNNEVDLIFETGNTSIKIPMKAIDTSSMGSNSRLELVCGNVDTSDENNKDMVDAVKNANESMQIYKNKVFDFKMKVVEEDQEGNKVKEEEIENFTSQEDIILRIIIGQVNQNTALMTYYYNPATKEWEYVRGSYENGSIKILTNHLSIYSVMTLTPEEKREMLTKLINDKDITIEEVLNILEDKDMTFKEKGKYNEFKQSQKEETARKIIDHRPNEGYENYNALEKEINSIVIEINDKNKDSGSSSSKSHSSSNNDEKDIENITIIKGKENIKVRDISSNGLKPKDQDMHIRGKIYEVEMKENKEALVKIKYDEKEVTNEEHLAVYKYDEESGKWESLGGVVDKEKNEISVSVKKTSKITIMEYNKTFTDLDDHWAKETIEILASRQIINGDADGKFRPNMGITRAEFATLITKTLGLEIETKETGFEDIKEDDWYAPYIAAARKAGIVSGVSDTEYQPNRIVSRQEMTAMVIRAYKNIKDVKVEIDVVERFKDNSKIADWAREDVYTAKSLKLVKGRTTEIFVPTSETLRGEAATLIYKLLEVLDKI